jgi:hypothetical protein
LTVEGEEEEEGGGEGETHTRHTAVNPPHRYKRERRRSMTLYLLARSMMEEMDLS